MADQFLTLTEINSIQALLESNIFGSDPHVSIGPVKVFDANGDELGEIRLTESGEWAFHYPDPSPPAADNANKPVDGNSQTIWRCVWCCAPNRLDRPGT